MLRFWRDTITSYSSGLLNNYQKEFERLGNRVHGWTQKALVVTLMGGLKPEIAEGIRMFKPILWKEAISFVRIWDNQLHRKREFTTPLEIERKQLEFTTSFDFNAISTRNRLPWDGMWKRELKVYVLIAMINFV